MSLRSDVIRSIEILVESLSLKLSDARICDPQIRTRLGTSAHFCKVVVLKFSHSVLQAKSKALDAEEEAMEARGADAASLETHRASLRKARPLPSEEGITQKVLKTLT